MASVAEANTFPQLLVQRAARHGGKPAIREKRRGIWHATSWQALGDEVAAVAAALAKRGLARGGQLALIGDNRPRLYITMSAAHWLGAGAAPLSLDLGSTELIAAINALRATHAYAEDQEQVDKLLAVLPRCPTLQCIVYDNERGLRTYRQPQLVSYAALLQEGRNESRPEPAPGADADIAFTLTSGAQTEHLSHGALAERARAAAGEQGLSDTDTVVACLAPTRAEQILFNFAQPLVVGHCVCFPESSDTLLVDMREMGPSHFLAPPGVFQSLQADSKSRMEDAGSLKRGLYRRHMDAGAASGDLLVRGPLRDVLGMSRLHAAHVAGNVNAETQAFFRALGIELKTVGGTEAKAEGVEVGNGFVPTAAPPATPSRAYPVGAPILELNNISLRFGGVNALTDISFNVREHEVLAIIGPNGAGKSSMLNVINGVYHPQEGNIVFRGEKQNMTPTRAAHMGISRTFQNIALFKGMSVLDNIMAGRTLRMHANFLEVAFQLPRARREEAEHRAVVEEIIEFLEIEHIRKTPVARLPYGLQKRVELGRALAAEPKILLLDEPMAGMNIEEKQDMSRFVLDVNDHYGTTVVLIEHDMGVVMDVSDRVVVLDYGKKIGDGTPDEVRANQDVINAYLGVAH